MMKCWLAGIWAAHPTFVRLSEKSWVSAFQMQRTLDNGITTGFAAPQVIELALWGQREIVGGQS